MDVLLHNAGAFPCFGAFFYYSLDLTVFLSHLNSLASVGVLSWLYDPHVELVIVLSVIVIIFEFYKVGVRHSFLHMESHWQRIKNIFSD